MDGYKHHEVELTELESVHGGMKWQDFPTSDNVEYDPSYVPDDGGGVLDGQIGQYDFANDFDYQGTGDGYDASAGMGDMGGGDY